MIGRTLFSAFRELRSWADAYFVPTAIYARKHNIPARSKWFFRAESCHGFNPPEWWSPDAPGVTIRPDAFAKIVAMVDLV